MDSIWESSAETGQMSRSAQLVGVLGTLTARNRKLRLPGPGAGPIIHRSRIRHPDFLPEGVTAIGQKGGYVSAVESVVDLGTSSNQNKKSNDIWSEWQDLNLRPLRPERSALPG